MRCSTTLAFMWRSTPVEDGADSIVASSHENSSSWRCSAVTVMGLLAVAGFAGFDCLLPNALYVDKAQREAPGGNVNGFRPPREHAHVVTESFEFGLEVFVEHKVACGFLGLCGVAVERTAPIAGDGVVNPPFITHFFGIVHVEVLAVRVIDGLFDEVFHFFYVLFEYHGHQFRRRCLQGRQSLTESTVLGAVGVYNYVFAEQNRPVTGKM